MNALVLGFFGPVTLVMDGKMLMGIKQRAEKQERVGRDRRGRTDRRAGWVQ